MERHKCKLCFKNFSNGRALGGHMRSHMFNLPVTEKHVGEEDDHGPHHNHNPPVQLSEHTESASSSSSSSGEEEDDEKGVCYGLRENPKRSVRLVDREFAFPVDASSVVLQDRESETESSKNPTRRRSKRTRKLLEYHQYHLHQDSNINSSNNIKKLKFNSKFVSSYKITEPWIEPEPVSSISDATTEEDVAFCLMMLSRDKWKRKEKQNYHLQLDEEDEDDEEDEEETEKSIDQETDESDEFKSCKTRVRGKYRCETCNKVFKSYQALGGHRASHKKLKLNTPNQETELKTVNYNAVTSSSTAVKKIHQCPYCLRVFSSGQALGGHKRSHVITGSTTVIRNSAARTAKNEDNLSLIDLNLPAPVDEDDLSQVSDAEFVNHIKR
ncbi:zinc finger protein ZAT9-like [Mercurialis annua]|uniref:zinc finger protein ZAT9-like n=1 Tax=Mercurialis annua TaxID=3986 RepID=UPI00215EE0F2|nr:zinc finger protein ZAT9-like [Mercurialis annua]